MVPPPRERHQAPPHQAHHHTGSVKISSFCCPTSGSVKINSFDTAPKKLLASDYRLCPYRFALEKGDLLKFGSEKSSLEERQQAEKRNREAKPRWFDMTAEVVPTPWGDLEVYQYNGKYTQHRAAIDSSDCIEEWAKLGAD